jgi:prophage regulatory protein
VTYEQLRPRGITYTREHIARLVKREQFPAPVVLSPNRIAWRSEDIEAWAKSRPVRDYKE